MQQLAHHGPSSLASTSSLPAARRSGLARTSGVAILLALLALLVLVAPVTAGRRWCSRDPVFKINGQVVDVLLSSYDEMNASVTGPTQIVLIVPEGVSASVIATDLGFGKRGYAISVRTSSLLQTTATSLPVVLEVYTPARDGTLPVKVDVRPRSVGLVPAVSQQGLANQWVVLRLP